MGGAFWQCQRLDQRGHAGDSTARTMPEPASATALWPLRSPQSNASKSRCLPKIRAFPTARLSTWYAYPPLVTRNRRGISGVHQILPVPSRTKTPDPLYPSPAVLPAHVRFTNCRLQRTTAPSPLASPTCNLLAPKILLNCSKKPFQKTPLSAILLYMSPSAFRSPLSAFLQHSSFG